MSLCFLLIQFGQLRRLIRLCLLCRLILFVRCFRLTLLILFVRCFLLILLCLLILFDQCFLFGRFVRLYL